MKILIAYYSMTGNTESIAKAMNEALAGEDVTLRKVEEVDPSTLKSYELLLLGSGIYAGRMHKSVQKLLKNTAELPVKCVLFYTHATAEPETYQPFPRNIRKLIEGCGSEICAEFECLGDNKNVTEDQVQQRLQGFSPEQKMVAEEQMERLKGHPNSEDLENAKAFVKSLL